MRETGDARISFRPVGNEDCALIYTWANDPVVRKYSFHPDPISIEEHERWFESTINDPSCIFLMILNAGKNPIGQIRFARDTRGSATISISISGRYRSHGWGTPSLVKACEKVFFETDIKALRGYVRKSNIPSKRMFEKAGFTCRGELVVEGAEAYLLELLRKDGKSSKDRR